MKKHFTLLTLLSMTAFALISCAGAGSKNTKALLSAAGFTERTPKTEKQKALYASAESYKVLRFTAKGKTLYAYKDEESGTAFIGNEKNYQKYQNLAIQQRIARDNYEAAEMQREMAMGWYGAWGYGYGPRPYYRYY